MGTGATHVQPLHRPPPARPRPTGGTREDAPRGGARRRGVAGARRGAVASPRRRGGAGAAAGRARAWSSRAAPPAPHAQPPGAPRRRARRRVPSLAPRAPRGRRKAPSARRSSRKRAPKLVFEGNVDLRWRCPNGHKRQPGSLHRIRTQLFFRVRDHSGRRGAVGAKKCGNRTIASEPAALVHANRPKSVRLEGWLRG